MKNAFIRSMALLCLSLMLALCLIACDGGSKDRLVFQTDSGVKVAVGTPADATLDTLGDWIACHSSPSCGGFTGLDYIYTYNGFRVSTTPSGSGDVICKVELTDDSVKTPEGLTIGMPRADVEAALKGRGTLETVGGNLVCSAGGVKLQVVFRNDAVTGIIYVAE